MLLDRIFSWRAALISYNNSAAHAVKTAEVHILTALIHMSRKKMHITTLSLFIVLKNNKRYPRYGNLMETLQRFVDIGYLTRSGKTLVHLTESGRQAHRDIEDAVKRGLVRTSSKERQMRAKGY